MFIGKVLQDYKEIFKSSTHFTERLTAYEKEYKKSALTQINNVIEEIGRNYFAALSPHPITFKMAATNLGELLMKLKG